MPSIQFYLIQWTTCHAPGQTMSHLYVYFLVISNEWKIRVKVFGLHNLFSFKTPLKHHINFNKDILTLKYPIINMSTRWHEVIFKIYFYFYFIYSD